MVPVGTPTLRVGRTLFDEILAAALHRCCWVFRAIYTRVFLTIRRMVVPVSFFGGIDCCMDMKTQRWAYTCDYLQRVFGKQDMHLRGLMDAAVEAGIPAIAVSADVGRLLQLLTAMTPGRLAIEVGTLAGYSGIWLARGLAEDGKLITIEKKPVHADFARAQFEKAGVAAKVDVRVGAGLDELPIVAEEVGEESVDVVFMDAIKTEYSDYWKLIRPLIAPGGLLVADNVLGSGGWWIDDEEDETRNAVDAFNRAVADDELFTTVALPIREGVMVARRNT